MGDRRAAAKRLQNMLKEEQEKSSAYYNCGLIDNDLFHWRVMIIGQPGTLYADGFFPAELTFPDDFPMSPPKMKFTCPMWHPNIGKDGTVCISILHPPGNDEYDYEKASERWLPIHTLESIIISVISMLEDPNPESPLNIEANRDYLQNRAEYNRKVRRTGGR
ncbi:Ubiquitin-conjugating enzyme E2 15 [Tritrichomonas foetus]|uniref:Ubiquitin-conjugating enzyme E2 15 n=1 Tax=Tritrichomonas foetus TaxID=1144522 RepID=A0A1J4JS48_9EUKA|nr:Ubiquitin-conjugating enzyme E2 15 [Tritrichomonas foetus]|eukprot:OHT01578.1 Ubiquitin-conjugating enzyme E2 15 [Tritrichomonas foetus]